MKWIARLLAFSSALILGLFAAFLLSTRTSNSSVPSVRIPAPRPFSKTSVEESFSDVKIYFDDIDYGKQLGDPFLRIRILNGTDQALGYDHLNQACQAEGFMNLWVNDQRAPQPSRDIGNVHKFTHSFVGVESLTIPSGNSAVIEITPFDFSFRPGKYDVITAEFCLRYENGVASRLFRSQPFTLPEAFRTKIPIPID